uniref:Knl1 C-terminal RWD domain-containing protein n=1 Tax=Eptatretus burgeri TaxID=7764 RepID=A0A8C4QVP8_EPTBU
MKKETISSTVLSKTKEIHSLKAEKADVKARCKEQRKKNTELIKELQEMEQELVKSLHSKTDYWGLSEWRLVNWDGNEAIFSFFFDSLVLAISFGRPLDTELCPAQPHMEVTKVNLVSFLDETHASDFARLVHRLLFSSAHMSEWQSQCGDTNQLSQLLLTVSTRVNVARSLFEELEALECNSFDMEIFSIKVEELRVSFVFSSLPAYAKFAIIFNVTPAYPHEPMHFEFRPMIGNISDMDVKKAVEAETPGRYYLWRLVNQVYHSLLLPPQKKMFHHQ